MRKRNQRQHDYNTMGRKLLCGKFAERLQNNFAVGDEDNNLLLYNILTLKPLAVLNAQVSNVSALTALTFTHSDDQIIAGSNRGSMNIWDLNTLKIASCLKGHTIEISCFFADKRGESLIASGSGDTVVKLWDLRTKNCLHTLKNHSRKVLAITIGADSRILASGGEDGSVFTSDIRMLRPIFQYEIQSPVLALDSSSRGLLAVGNLDRIARLYELGAPFALRATTKSETMPVNACVFYKEDYLFSAGTDNLKVWDVKGDICMTDSIETSAKGILHMVVTENMVQQITFSAGTLAYHQCLLGEVHFDGPYVNSSIVAESSKVRDKTEDAIERNDSISKVTRGRPAVSYVTNEKTRQLINRKSESVARELTGMHSNVNDALISIKKVTQEFNNRKNEELELRESMGEEHSRFMKIIGARTKAISSILDLWMRGNIKGLIQSLKSCDVYVVSDVLAQILRPSKVQISAEFALTIAEKAKEMINSKHLSLIKNGLQYMLHIVNLFKEEMGKLKTYADKAVDLARDERLRRYDLLMEQYVEVYQSHRLKRIADKKDEASKLAEQLTAQFVRLFKKVFGQQYQL